MIPCFSRALTSEDSGLILQTCRDADLTALLAAKAVPPVNQLALVHFLGQGLTGDQLRDTCAYIQEVMVGLDEEEPFTAQHLPDIKAKLAATIKEEIGRAHV